MTQLGRQLLGYLSPPPVPYHGLFNQGATCYLNSVLQVLFMSRDFRVAVKRHTMENPGTDCIDCQLTTLFDDLEQRASHTSKITSKLGIDRVYEQHDAAEYFEKILDLASTEASKIFHGILTHRTICSACGKESDNDAAFWHLPLALMGSYSKHYSVVEGIAEHFRDSDFSEENQMYCDECNDKSDATIKCVLKNHPDVLMLLLKRFELDYRYLTYVKNNRPVVVPFTLQIPEDQSYELYAIVDHYGDLWSGHNTAVIKDDEKWYHFNDRLVKVLDEQPFEDNNFQESSSAYLLFYRKMKVPASDTCSENIRHISTPEVFPPATNDIHEKGQDPVKMGEKEEAEEAAEQRDETLVIVIDRNEETELKDNVRSQGVGPPDRSYHAENQDNGRQSISYRHWEYNEEKRDLSYLQEEQRGDEEHMGGNTGKREVLSRETQLKERSKDQGNDNRSLDDVRQRGPQEGLEGDIHDKSYYDQKHEQGVRNVHATEEYKYTQEVCVDMPRDITVYKGNDGKMEGDERSERRWTTSAKYHHGDARHQGSERVKDVRHNKKEDLRETQIGQDHRLKPVSVDEPVDEEGMEVDVDEDKQGKTEVGERGLASEDGKFLTKYDLCSHKYNGRVGEEQQREVRGAGKEEMEQKRRDEKHAHWRETSERPFGHDVDDQNNGGLDDLRCNRSEQKISGTHARQKDVGVVRQTKERGSNYVLKPVSVDEPVDDEGMEIDVDEDKQRKTEVGERAVASDGGKFLTKYDLCYGGVGDSRTNRPKNDLSCEQGGTSKRMRQEQQRESRSVGMEEKEKKRRDDKHAHWRDLSERHPPVGQDVDDQNSVGFDDLRLSRSEQRISGTRTSYKDISVERWTKEQGTRGDRHYQNRAESSLREERSAGSRRQTEALGIGSVDKISPGYSQAKARPELNEEAMEKRPSSRKPTHQKKVIEEEIKKNPRAVQRGGEENYVIIKTIEETSREGLNRWEREYKGNLQINPERTAYSTLPTTFSNLQLSPSQLQEPQKHRTKKNSRFRPYWSRPKQNKDKVRKKKKTTKCFDLVHFLHRKKKNADPKSESE